MKNRGVTGARLPGMGHKTEGPPAPLPERNVADRAQPEPAAPQRVMQEGKVQSRNITPKPPAMQSVRCGARKYSLSLRIDKRLADAFTRLLAGQSPSARTAIRRRLAASLHARLDAGADFPSTSHGQDLATVRLDLRLRPDFVARIRRRQDPQDLLPATTALAQVIAPEYAALIDALLRRAAGPAVQ